MSYFSALNSWYVMNIFTTGTLWHLIFDCPSSHLAHSDYGQICGISLICNFVLFIWTQMTQEGRPIAQHKKAIFKNYVKIRIPHCVNQEDCLQDIKVYCSDPAKNSSADLYHGQTPTVMTECCHRWCVTTFNGFKLYFNQLMRHSRTVVQDVLIVK